MTSPRTFDRAIRFDPRSRDFPATLGYEDAPLRSYTWNFPTATYLDQGVEGACVGFSWAHRLAARPTGMHSDADLARTIYRGGQKIDEWAGEDYSGTSVLAGAKMVKTILETDTERELVSYRWAFGVEDVARVLGYIGGAVLGIGWLADMNETDENGFIHASGKWEGNHAIFARGVRIVWRDKLKSHTFPNLDVEQSYVLLRNSWGRDWGVDGDAKVSILDLSKLLERDGEACIPIIRKR